MPRIYLISHADETTDLTDYLAELLRTRYGPQNVVRGTSAPTAEVDQGAVERDLRACDVALVVMGRSWLAQVDDATHVALATALRMGMLVAPVLSDGATMPGIAQLPPDLAGLPHIQAFPVRPAPDFTSDMNRLYQQINTKLTWRPTSAVLAALACLCALLWVVYTALNVAILSGAFETSTMRLFMVTIAWVGPVLVVGISIAALRLAIRRRSKRWPWVIASAIVLSVVAFFLPGHAALLDLPATGVWVAMLLLFAFIGPRRETAFS
jgi:hypothetical protein